MENKIKVIIIILVALCGCSQNDKNCRETKTVEEIQQENLEEVYSNYFSGGYVGKIINQNEKLFFVVNCMHCNSSIKQLSFSTLKTLDNHTLEIKNVVDNLTFRLVGLSVEEKNNINNPYYLGGRMTCYYRDKDNIYAFLDKKNPEFIILGLWENATLLGGNYLRIEDKIFSQGIIIPLADVETFHTMKVSQLHNKSEWYITIGLDKNHIYLNEKIMDTELFNKITDSNDSLKQIYFDSLGRQSTKILTRKV